MSWRSPPMVPRPRAPGSVALPSAPAARIALGGAWRLRAFAHSLGHGLRRAPASHHRAVVARIDACLAASDLFRTSGALGDDPSSDAMIESLLAKEPLPSSASWAECAMADSLFGHALDLARESLVDSSDDGLARAARSGFGAPFGDDVVDELASDAPNRACLQLLVERWAEAAARVSGRPGTSGDAEAVAAKLKRKPAGASTLAWLRSTERRLERWGLYLPDAQFMGIEVEEDWMPARRPKGPLHRIHG